MTRATQTTAEVPRVREHLSWHSDSNIIVFGISCSCADEEGNSQSETEERLPDLPLLSEQLLLDELWDMLGECLKELEESHDQHAVLGTLGLQY